MASSPQFDPNYLGNPIGLRDDWSLEGRGGGGHANPKKFVADFCTSGGQVYSIAVSLSKNSIRRQDPNHYSDTEMRALSWVKCRLESFRKFIKIQGSSRP